MYEKIDIPQPLADEILQKAEAQGVSADDVVMKALRQMLGKEDDNAGE